jgi:hypothetical protein
LYLEAVAGAGKCDTGGHVAFLDGVFVENSANRFSLHGAWALLDLSTGM